MATADKPPTGLIDDQNASASQSSSRFRYVWIALIVLIILVGLGILEGMIYLLRDESVKRIHAWSQAQSPGADFALQEMEKQLVGSPERAESKHQGSRRVIYTWPGYLGRYTLRVRVSSAGNVTYADTEHRPDEDFTTPFLVAGQNDLPDEQKINLWAESAAVFDKPKPVLLPGMVIFPVTDHEGVIVPTGPALSMTAQHSLAYTTRKRMAIDPRLVRRTLMEAQCWSPGTRIEASRIDLCLKMIGATSYALPRIQQQNGDWQIQIELHDSATAEPTQLEFHAKELNQVPGVVAMGLFEHRGATLSSEERSTVMKPQFQHAAEAEYFSNFTAKDLESQEGVQQFHTRLLSPNPQWIAAWDYHLESGHAERPVDPRVRECPTIAVVLAPRGATKRNFLTLLKFAPDLRGEAHYHLALTGLARGLDDRVLVGQMLTTWKAENNSYPSRIARAETFYYLQQFDAAEEELKQALVLNPQSWTARAELVRVATGQSKTWEQIHQHFEQAIRLDPDNKQAWQYIMVATWTGGRIRAVNPDDMFRFAHECLDSGLWDQGVPQQVPDLLRGIAYDSGKKSVDLSKLQHPEHWKVMEKFYRLAQRANLSPEVLRHAQACFAHDAAITGHFVEAAPVFDLLDMPYSAPPSPSPSGPQTAQDPLESRFSGRAGYIELRDKVRKWVRDMQ